MVKEQMQMINFTESGVKVDVKPENIIADKYGVYGTPPALLFGSSTKISAIAKFKTIAAAEVYAFLQENSIDKCLRELNDIHNMNSDCVLLVEKLEPDIARHSKYKAQAKIDIEVGHEYKNGECVYMANSDLEVLAEGLADATDYAYVLMNGRVVFDT